MFYTDMDLAPICNSLEWLLGEQEQDGNFRELRPPIHREMHVSGCESFCGVLFENTMVSRRRLQC